MSEPAGLSVAAMQARQAALVRQHTTVADADRVLAEVLASVHSAVRESCHRLDAIADELDRTVADQDELALDTPTGVHEFQAFLVARQRETAAIVANARELGHVKTAVLEALRAQYAVPVGSPGRSSAVR
jgi:Domain of unknown function (DUF4226)